MINWPLYSLNSSFYLPSKAKWRVAGDCNQKSRSMTVG